MVQALYFGLLNTSHMPGWDAYSSFSASRTCLRLFKVSVDCCADWNLYTNSRWHLAATKLSCSMQKSIESFFRTRSQKIEFDKQITIGAPRMILQ